MICRVIINFASFFTFVLAKFMMRAQRFIELGLSKDLISFCQFDRTIYIFVNFN